MAITTIANIKANYLGLTDSGKDSVLTAMLTQATSLAESICHQPLDAQTVVYDFSGDGSQAHVVPFTTPVQLSTLQYKQLPTDAAFTSVTGAVAFKADHLWHLYYEDAFTYTLWRATLTVGYDGSTYAVPADLVNIVSEMVVDLYRNTNHTAKENRFGLTSVSVSDGAGMTTTTVLADMRKRWKDKLKPYTRKVYL